MAIVNNREYIEKTLSRFGVDGDTIDLIMIDNSELEELDHVDSRACKVAMYGAMSTILPSMCSNVTEGGYSVSWNMDGLKLWFKSLCGELGLSDTITQPKVRNRSNRW